jgi:predicted DCC family thiol-disulfide oxidoreductase YuxK
MGAIASVENDLLLFDGVCNFCNSSVNFIIRHEQTASLKFASLQSDVGQQVLGDLGYSSTDFDSLVLVKGGKAWKKSRAVFELCKNLRAPWRYVRVFRFLPAFLTDFFYDLIARNRYRLFGKSEACSIPSPELRARFVGS